MIPYSTLVAMVAVRASPMPVFLSLVIFNWPEVVKYRYRIFAVLRRHTRSQRHACGHRAIHVVHGERWERYTWPHTDGEGCTRRARGRSEQRATDAYVEKYRCILRIYASLRAISGLSYVYTRSGGGTRGSGVRMQRAVRRAQPSRWPEGLISLEGLGPLTF